MDIIYHRSADSEIINDEQERTPEQPTNSTQNGVDKATERHTPYFWDIMRDTRNEEHVTISNDHIWDNVYVVLKAIMCIFLFLLVLTTAVVHQLCLVLSTSNLYPPWNDTNQHWKTKTANSTITYPKDATNVQWIWGLVLIISTPYFLTTLSSAWQFHFKKESSDPGWNGIILVMILETMHSFGLCMLVFVILPSLDPIACILVCFQVAGMPGLLGAIGRQTHKTRALIIRAVLIIGVVLQISASGLTCAYYVLEAQTDLNYFTALLLVLIPSLVSISWWENYLILEGKDKSLSGKIARCINNIQARRQKFNIVGNLWKIFITLIFPLLLFGIPCQDGMDCINALFGHSHNISTQQGIMHSFVGRTKLISDPSFDHCDNYLPIIVAVVSIVCSVLCYKAAKVGCSILAQIFCMSLPLYISSPVAVGVLIGYLGRNVQDNNQTCDLPFPYWSDQAHTMSEHVNDSYYWMVILSGIFGYLSFLIIGYHVWIPGKKRLQKSKQLFSRSIYCGVLLCQSIPLNRRRKEDEAEIGAQLPSAIEGPSEGGVASSVTPLVYICATMWHEKKSEMKKLMQSILRLDEDQRNRSYFSGLVGDFDDDFYNFEVHIFFDDAFRTEIKDNTKSITLNEYVTDLLDVVQETTGNEKCLTNRCETVYGGKLEWSLPNGNKVVAHLKNKEKIRVRKRWSQVMYMYYFLGYKLLGEVYQSVTNIDELMQKLEVDQGLREKATNTFILALDGDVDFKPQAVRYLMDRMKKHPNIGAACGRIHPTGNGLMIWYQKFEYAVSHWLQKVAEDTLGCVLCSPGCFSLFRGLALMDNNVMKVYTTRPTKGRHHVQYDQGEDRWLCTLLLQQGYRVEYVAASDALTDAPENFSEFFNQRRRWSPSTMANILDLLLDWKLIIRKNPDISTVYIFYQAFLMLSSILTPGTIFLMLIAAINTAYSAIDLWVVLLINIVLMGVFIVVCFNAKSETQLTFAGILSIVYSIVMLLVIIGLAITIAENGLCSVTAIFFIYVAGVFVISALLHPQEFFCIFYGFLYFLAIPATSVVMVLYTLCNLNITSWGTRESTQTSSGNDTGNQGNPRIWLDVPRTALRCLCCPQEIDQRYILQRLDQLEGQLIQQRKENTLPEGTLRCSSVQPVVNDSFNCETVKNNWIHGDKLKGLPLGKLDADEQTFWENIIKRYLSPLVQTDEEKQRVQVELTAVRNKVCLFFILANAIFICIIFTLQQYTGKTKSLSIRLPCVTRSGKEEYVEPISLTFTFIFGVILLVQFICMLRHRLGTLVHICARTEIFKFKLDDEKTNKMQLFHDLERANQRSESQNLSQSIFIPNIGKSNKADKLSTVVSKSQTVHEESKESITGNSFTDKCKTVVNYVTLRQIKKKRLERDKEMKKIQEEFPNLSKESHMAIFRMLSDQEIGMKSMRMNQGAAYNKPSSSNEKETSSV